MIMLGIDPGFQFAGFGIIKKEGSKATVLDYGFLKMNPTKSLDVRLGIFYDFFMQKVQTHGVTNLALETPFLGKNAQNFLKLGYLRGALYLVANKNNLIIHEFSPTQVKLSVTGHGGASKEQVARVVLQLFPKMITPEKEDVTDALAVTLCGLWQHRYANLLQGK
ncbi:MAG: crossover junction endodeoxyribonuclease RuvC [Candidatus Babeliales bacterium]|nr:crossover junction endodeoxyribonuclease RuvC [Candidatus Babeliales bacterium]